MEQVEHKKGLVRHMRRELMAALFMASLLVILHHWLPLIDILDRFAFLFASSTSLQVSAEEPRTVVIGIDQKTFEQDFLERSPLDRCVMADKLGAIYADRPALLVVDFDLSPSLAGILPNEQDGDRERECEAKLYAQIDSHAAATRTVLLEPFPVANEQAQAAKVAWKAAQVRRGVFFGDGALPVQFGFVQQQYLRPQTLAAVANANPNADADAGAESSHSVLQLLNFRAFARDVRSLSWDDWARRSPATSLAGKNVFFGAGYGSDDRFLTPIDDLYGVNLHAAGFVSLRNPISLANAGFGFLADIGVGMLFGVPIALLWQGYVGSKLSRSGSARKWRDFAFVFLMGLLVVYAMALSGLSHAAVYLVAAKNIWISPLPMALGMTLDASIFGALNAVEHVSGRHRSTDAGKWGGDTARRSWSSRLVSAMKGGFWLLIVGYALLLMTHH
jgi:hypothetical protein